MEVEKFKKAIVTGGAGFLGSHLVDALLEDGYDVTVIDSLERGTAENLSHCLDRITFIHRDLREPSQILTPTGDYLVFDFAAKVFGVRHLYETPWTLMTDNIQITMNNLRRWSNAKKYVYISSSCVYDFNEAPIPHKEGDFGYLNSFYGWGKIFGELCCQALDEEKGFNYTVIRPFNTYGPRETLLYPHVIPDFIRKGYDCKYRGVKTFEILGDGKQTRSFTYSSDAVSGIMLGAKLGEKTAYNISSPEETTIMELAELIWDIMDINPEPVFKPAPTKEVKKRYASTLKAEQELGWKAKVDLKEGLKRTVEWMVPRMERLREEEQRKRRM